MGLNWVKHWQMCTVCANTRLTSLAFPVRPEWSATPGDVSLDVNRTKRGEAADLWAYTQP